ncbi:MAG TPA: trypsin-like peptidase domain-containing protein [Trebonia sp.]|jgi:S1-C subfamily serine protease|nr:trypsin-like peptidase domain-containing protein [Trebonia sp.]
MSEPFAHYPYGQYPIPEPPRKRRGMQALSLTATAVVALAAGAGAGVALSHGSSSGNGATTATSKSALSTSQIAKNVDPGLVDINTTLGYQNAAAAGTGIVLTSNGEILTNNHVIEGATSISVTDIGNGKTYKATVVGYDQSQDVAVIQLTGASGLKTASLGNSSTVGAGDKVVALGNAGGVGGTPSVAAGEVVALNQSITASDESSGLSENLTGLIESNADIQAGDSGGSLVNQYGEVIGMDTAASSGYQLNPNSGGGGSSFGGNGFGGFGDNGSGSGQSGNGFGSGGFGDNGSGSSGFGSSGFGDNGSSGSGSSSSGSSSEGSAVQGYSIPINTALSIAQEIEGGHASSTVHIGETAFLGIEISSTGTQSGGVQIAGAASGTPAETAGLTAGDVITSVNGTSVDSYGAIQQILEGNHPGDKVSVGWTDTSGQSHTTTITLANGPAD